MVLLKADVKPGMSDFDRFQRHAHDRVKRGAAEAHEG
jgi:hypothetical protein